MLWLARILRMRDKVRRRRAHSLRKRACGGASAMCKPEGDIDPSRDLKTSLRHDSEDAKEVA